MRYVDKDARRKEYDYFSRYRSIDTYYNKVDKKRFYGLSLPLNKNINTYSKHIVSANDSLDSIALKYYGNPLYWWIIADINNILDPFNIRVGTELRIPSLSSISF